jgi:DHA1 family multidrug resistance protein-like MFS transporter
VGTNRSRRIPIVSQLVFASPLYISVFLMRFSFGLVLFTLPIYLPKQEFSYFVVGMIAAAYPATEIIAAPVIGVLTDWFGRRRWIYVGLTLSTLALFAFTLHTAVLYLIIVHAVQGLAAAMIVVSTLAMTTDLSTVTNRGREMGIYDFANLGGYVVGIFAAGVLVRTHSLTAPFYFASGLAAAGAVFAYLRVKEVESHERQSALSPVRTLRLLLNDKRAAAMFPIWLAVTTFIGMALTFGPRLGPSPLYTSVLIGGLVLILALSQPFFGYLSDRYGRDRLMMFGLVSLIGLFATIITMFRHSLEFAYVAPFLAIFGIGSFAFAPAALASLGDLAPERGRGTTMGIYSVVISLGTIIGPLLGGYLLDRYGVSSLFYVGIVILIGAMSIAIMIVGPDFRYVKPLSWKGGRSRPSP